MFMKHVVVIGGGHGLAVILRGIKHLADIKLSAIVTVADDGGSTGRLRQQYQIPAMGDIRNVMCAMAESETLLSSLMNYRFEGDEGDVAGHNLGNLILTALSQSCGSFMDAIQTFSKVLKVKGDIIPSTTDIITLYAVMEDGTIVRGESNIPTIDNHIRHVFYDRPINASRQAIEAIHDADYIIYGIGSLYTSIMPNLIIEEIREELRRCHVKKVYFCNAMTQPGETDNYTLEEHVHAICEHTFPHAVDIVVTHDNTIHTDVLDHYMREGSKEVRAVLKEHSYELMKRDILKFEDGLIRHDSNKIRDVVDEILRM